MSALRCNGLGCGYEGHEVLSDVYLDLAPGTITALLGVNGSGKSTLLKTLIGELPLLAGDVSLSDCNLNSLNANEIARQVAYVPQEELPTFAFSVKEVVTMGRFSNSRGLFDTAEDHEKASEAMAMADCNYLQDRPITDLSGGERQRVLIARALAQQTPLLLLDEPTSHLDIAHQMQIVQLLKRLANDGVTILISLHDLNLASVLADQAAILHEGKIHLSGPMQTLLENPELEHVYETSFHRFRGEDGLMRLYPILSV